MSADLKIVPSGTDAQRATEFKRRLVETYAPVLLLLDEIKAAGFEANIGTGLGPLGKVQIVNLVIAKHY